MFEHVFSCDRYRRPVKITNQQTKVTGAEQSNRRTGDPFPVSRKNHVLDVGVVVDEAVEV
jgi:hypothetical protein